MPRDLLVRMTNAGDEGREAALPLAARPRALSSHGHWTGPPQCPLPPPGESAGKAIGTDRTQAQMSPEGF
jgi:hypothetical protein